MIATEPQLAEPKATRRWFRFSRRKLLVLTLLFVVSGIGLAFWTLGLPLSWTADYDRDRYTRIHRAIQADPQHLLGKSFDEVAKEFSLEGVPWDDGAFQQPSGMFRIYHFRGFALYVTLELLPAGITPNSPKPWSSTVEGLQRHGVLWLAHQDPVVRIDGISSRKERMERYWKAIDEECERINAEMERNRKAQSQ
jgi:hypothetical protein